MSALTTWQFKQSEWHINSTIPQIGTWYNAKPHQKSHQIHIDLLYNDLIIDPFVDNYELNVSWVGEVKWEYKTLFDSVTTEGYLVLDQLDNNVDVYLNQELILHSENSFQKHLVGPLQFLKKNELKLVLDSGFGKGKQLESKFGAKECWNGDCSRVYVRKPQYQYGWDWGPTLLSCGFNEILVVNDSFVEDFFVKYDLNEELNVAYLRFEISSLLVQNWTGKIEILNDQVLVDEVSIKDVQRYLTINHILHDVELWWPIKHGKQNIYTFKLYFGNKSMMMKTTGFRKVELINNPDKYGESFYFKINNESIQMIGSNWIPPHSFISTMTKQDYNQYLKLFVDSNQNMIRVWGGGNYESKEFYNICDELGILVWQDFMFACGIYPYEPLTAPARSIEKEIEDTLKRLRNHPSIIIYVGNNEDYQIADALKLDQNNHTEFPAKMIYEELIPSKISQLTNQVVYRPGSPYSSKNMSSYNTSYGDSHQWEVWHGSRQPYQNWDNLTARFISEFGTLSLPSYNLLNHYITDKQELTPDSNIIKFHTRAANKKNLPYYVWSNFNKPDNLDLKTWIYLTQIMQSEAIELAFRIWRNKWVDFQCGGILVWQFNDCYPSVSWSIVEFGGSPKLSYYGMKRELADVVIAGYRYEEEIKFESSGKQVILSNDENQFKFDVWGFGNTLQNLTLKLNFYNGDGIIIHEYVKDKITFRKNEVNNILIGYSFNKENIMIKNDTIMSLNLISSKGEVIARSSNWPNYLKDLEWSKLTKDLKITHKYMSNNQIKLSTNKPVKKLQIYFDSNHGEEINYIFSDNGIDLFPNDDQVITIFEFNETDLKYLKIKYLDY
ncbi:mndB [Candida jiufengensis]|uniref:mndB n=1 Tax=Candida jiufengensis TaxID=497108 RepID=UPI0022249025|nr:mndB [Candida jiufengensis]KAI5950835.1 mndB [Candida jiufengensis]